MSLAAAGLGAVLPLVPTTVFLLLAAWAFGRASPRLRAKLLADPRFGRILRDWEESGAIGPRAKRAALSAMGLSWLLMALLVRNVLALAVAGACLAAVSVYILTRPSPDQPQEPDLIPAPGSIDLYRGAEFSARLGSGGPMEGQYFSFTKADPSSRQIAAAARPPAAGMSWAISASEAEIFSSICFVSEQGTMIGSRTQVPPG